MRSIYAPLSLLVVLFVLVDPAWPMRHRPYGPALANLQQRGAAKQEADAVEAVGGLQASSGSFTAAQHQPQRRVPYFGVTFIIVVVLACLVLFFFSWYAPPDIFVGGEKGLPERHVVTPEHIKNPSQWINLEADQKTRRDASDSASDAEAHAHKAEPGERDLWRIQQALPEDHSAAKATRPTRAAPSRTQTAQVRGEAVGAAAAAAAGGAGVTESGSSAATPIPKDQTLQSSGATESGKVEIPAVATDLVMATAGSLPQWVATESGRAFPQCPVNDIQNVSGWCELNNPENFKLRGKNYLKDKKKIVASTPAFLVHQVYIFNTTSLLHNATTQLSSLKAFIEGHPQHFFLVFNRLVPDRYKADGSFLSVLVLMVRQLAKGSDPSFDQAFDQYMAGDMAFRSRRLKYIPSLRKAPMVVKNAVWIVGGEKPFILNASQMPQQHYVGPNFLEIEIDCSPSQSAVMGVALCMKHMSSMVTEELLTIEGKTPEELPERPLAAWRWVKLDPDQAIHMLSDEVLGPLPMA